MLRCQTIIVTPFRRTFLQLAAVTSGKGVLEVEDAETLLRDGVSRGLYPLNTVQAGAAVKTQSEGTASIEGRQAL